MNSDLFLFVVRVVTLIVAHGHGIGEPEPGLKLVN